MSPRARMLAGFLLANLTIVLVAATVLLNRPAAPPRIQGVLLPQARMLPEFQLLDHHHRVFTNKDLAGRWHLVSYGFTTCPDVCPTTLSQLAAVSRELRAQGHTELAVLFYTVDHRRDTVAQMASYVPFFDPEFTGLTHEDNNDQHRPFERGLGIVSRSYCHWKCQTSSQRTTNTRSCTALNCSCSTRRANYRPYWNPTTIFPQNTPSIPRPSCTTIWRFAAIWTNASVAARVATAPRARSKPWLLLFFLPLLALPMAAYHNPAR
jgi:cytochrome oxidase Cu insertion factor (SCO1/SenC/PrrC family)